jgi:hypothetical protein
MNYRLGVIEVGFGTGGNEIPYHLKKILTFVTLIIFYETG